MMGSRKVRVFVHQMNSDLTEGDLFLFTGKDGARCKVLFFDGTGICIFQKRLSRGRFANLWRGGRAQLTHSELSLFLEGCTQVGHMELSPRPLQPSDMTLGAADFV
jgi:transposase